MKITFSRQELEDTIVPIASIIPKNPIMPSHACVFIRISAGQMICTATDGLVTIRKSIPVPNNGDVELMIDGKTLVAAIKNLQADNMELKIFKLYIQVSDVGSKYKIPLANDIVMFPVEETEATTVDLDLSEFLRLRTAPSFCAPNDPRVVFNGVCVRRDPSGMSVYACDGPSAYRFLLPYASEVDTGQIFIPANLFDIVFKLIDKDDEDRFFFSMKHSVSTIHYKGFCVTTMNFDAGASAPDFNLYFNPGEPVLMNPDLVKGMASRVIGFCDSIGAVNFKLSGGKLTISSINTENENSEAVAEEQVDTMADIDVTLSAKGLIQIMSAATSNFIDVSSGSGVKALYMVDRKSNIAAVRIGLAINA